MSNDVQAEVHKRLAKGLRLKVSIPSIGMYINGFRAFPPTDESDWYIFPPQNKVGNKWINIVEFDKESDLWLQIYKACRLSSESFIESENDIYSLPDNDFTKYISEELENNV